MPLDLTQTLSDLVALPSVNPMGRTVSGPEYLRVSRDRLSGKTLPAAGPALSAANGRAEARQHRGPARRPDAAGRRRAARAVRGPSRHRAGDRHDDRSLDPVVRDGRIYGRGACDIKGGLTAMLGALARLVEERPADMPTIVMACTVNEEHGFSGATALDATVVRARLDHSAPTRRGRGRRADATASRGRAQRRRALAMPRPRAARPTARSRTWASMPSSRCSACSQRSSVISSEIAPTLAEHRAVRTSDAERGHDQRRSEREHRARRVHDRNRSPPGARRKCRGGLSARGGLCVGRDRGAIRRSSTSRRSCSAPACSDQGNAALARADGRRGAPKQASRAKPVGVPYGTDASAIGAAGVPSIVFGPGSIDQAHTADEWLALDQLEQASEVLYQFARRGESARQPVGDALLSRKRTGRLRLRKCTLRRPRPC